LFEGEVNIRKNSSFISFALKIAYSKHFHSFVVRIFGSVHREKRFCDKYNGFIWCDYIFHLINDYFLEIGIIDIVEAKVE